VVRVNFYLERKFVVKNKILLVSLFVMISLFIACSDTINYENTNNGEDILYIYPNPSDQELNVRFVILWVNTEAFRKSNIECRRT
jgi:hypothetical protein